MASAKSLKAKGSRFERYLVERFREGVDKNSHRTAGSGSGLDKNDIRIPSLNIEVEAKNTNGFQLTSWLKQADRQTTTGNDTVIIARDPSLPEFQRSLVIMDLELFIELLQNQSGDSNVIANLDPQVKWQAEKTISEMKKLSKMIET